MSILLNIQIKVRTFTILAEGVMVFLRPSTKMPEQYLKLGHAVSSTSLSIPYSASF